MNMIPKTIHGMSPHDCISRCRSSSAVAWNARRWRWPARWATRPRHSGRGSPTGWRLSATKTSGSPARTSSPSCIPAASRPASGTTPTSSASGGWRSGPRSGRCAGRRSPAREIISKPPSDSAASSKATRPDVPDWTCDQHTAPRQGPRPRPGLLPHGEHEARPRPRWKRPLRRRSLSPLGAEAERRPADRRHQRQGHRPHHARTVLTVPRVKRGLAPIRTIGACPRFASITPITPIIPSITKGKPR